MWCIKTIRKETTRLLLNKLTTERSSSIFGVGNSRFSHRTKKSFRRQYRLRHLFIFFRWVSLEYLCKIFLLLLNYLLSKKIEKQSQLMRTLTK